MQYQVNATWLQALDALLAVFAGTSVTSNIDELFKKGWDGLCTLFWMLAFGKSRIIRLYLAQKAGTLKSKIILKKVIVFVRQMREYVFLAVFSLVCFVKIFPKCVWIIRVLGLETPHVQ